MKNLALTKKIQLLMALALFIFFGQLSYAGTNYDPTLFFDGSYENAREKAGEEGKLFMVDFYANWCTPCKWMEKTTFQNEGVTDILNQDYVSIKIDIDQPEGYDLKEQFDVNMLPTILIFNSQGKMVERIEKTLTAESLVTILNFHNQAKNKIVQKHMINTSPKKSTTIKKSYDEDYSQMYADYQKSQKRKSNYRVQVANYSNYEEAFVRVNNLRETFLEPIIVLNDYKEGTTWYKVLLGEFKSMEEAESFRVILKNDFNIDGIIY